ncbi:hypothetical protein [Vibrio intestinalis]|uniref:hypothetical protein n=1 Tax=Vibrio intestinalis TaxID=2933291 RepID=UPI0021A8D4CA|nr:hypothetical protein [Vibrio intestinalis]
MMVVMLVIGLFGAKTAYAVHPQIDVKNSDITSTLCSDEEDIYFSAKLNNGKFASLCGYKHKSPDTGYVKYRYGFPDNIELEYPKDEGTPKGRFLTYHIRLSPNVQGRTIFFHIGKYRYDISHVAGNCSVFAYEGKKVVFESFCNEELWLNTFDGRMSGRLILNKEFVKRFPQQFQDPTEPEFH